MVHAFIVVLERFWRRDVRQETASHSTRSYELEKVECGDVLVHGAFVLLRKDLERLDRPIARFLAARLGFVEFLSVSGGGGSSRGGNRSGRFFFLRMCVIK